MTTSIYRMFYRLRYHEKLDTNLTFSPVIVVTGIPQSGKTFMVEAIKDWLISQGFNDKEVKTFSHSSLRRDLFASMENFFQFAADWSRAFRDFNASGDEILYILED